MRCLYFIITLLSHFISYSQTKENNNMSFLISINYSPDYCSRLLKNSDGSLFTDVIIDGRNNSETAKLGYTTGLNGCINFSQNIGLETGIQYSNKGYQNLMQDLSPFYIDSTSSVKGKSVSSFHYLDMPLKVNFIFGKRKLQFCGSVGIAANILLKQTVLATLEFEDGSTQQQKLTSTQYNKFNLSPLISAGVNYQISNSMNFKIEPTFRYGILKVANSEIGTYLWNIGLNMGCYYVIK